MNVMRLFAEPTLSKLPVTHAVDGAQDGGIGLTSMMSLPSAFGEIYMGQTFNCYINVVNNSDRNVEIRGAVLHGEARQQQRGEQDHIEAGPAGRTSRALAEPRTGAGRARRDSAGAWQERGLAR